MSRSLGQESGERQPALEKWPQAFKKKKADWGLEDLDPHFLCRSSGFAEIRMRDYEKSGSERTFFKHWQNLARGPESLATLMRKKGKHTSNPDPDLDSLRQKQEMKINKTKYAWRWAEGPAGLCQLDDPSHDLRPRGARWEMTRCLHRLRTGSWGPGEVGFVFCGFFFFFFFFLANSLNPESSLLRVSAATCRSFLSEPGSEGPWLQDAQGVSLIPRA